MNGIREQFTSELGSNWRRYVRGSGRLAFTGETLRFVNQDTTTEAYSNAQIDDYQGLPRRRFPWRPPLTLTVRARFSHPAGALSGTAGFGFWNDPFLMTGKRVPTLPRALWFFYASSPSNMKLDLETPGRGWKAATIDALRWPFFLLLPTAPLAVPLMNVKRLYRRLWPLGQRAIGVREAALPTEMTVWHTYEIAWVGERVRFRVDGKTMLDCDSSPTGRLGFVAWLDNQYMIVTPWGRLGHGLLEAPGEQWMELDRLSILSIEPQGRLG